MKNTNGSNGCRESASLDANFPTFWDSDETVKRLLRHLSQVTQCSVAGLLVVEGHRGRILLSRTHPVDDLFLQAMQNRLVSSYQTCLGSAAAGPEIDVVVYGDAIAGPYEPPRSLLTAPVLSEGRVVGVVIIASVFSEAFCSQDLCTLSAVAAQVSVALNPAGTVSEQASELGGGYSDRVLTGWQGADSREHFQSRIRHYVTSICGLARLWQSQDESEIPEVLRQDLNAIAENALQIRELLAR